MNRIERLKTLEKAKDDIESALDRDGSYSHNVITLVLQGISKKLGEHVADQLIDEYDLESLGWEKQSKVSSPVTNPL